MVRPFEILCEDCGAWTDGKRDDCAACGRPRGEFVVARGAGLDVLAKVLVATPKGHG